MKLLIIGADDALSRLLTDGLKRLLPDVDIVEWLGREWQDEVRGNSGVAPRGASSVDTALYLAGPRGGRHGVVPDLPDAEAVFEALPTPLTHLVVLSSAAVHEPSAHHPQLLDETRLAPRRAGNALSDAWQALEALAHEAFSAERFAAAALTVLRPSPLLVPGGRDYWSRQVRRPLAFPAPGYDPMLQCLALEDLTAAVATAIEKRPAPAERRLYAVAPRDFIALGKMLRRARTWRIPMPLLLQRPLRAALAPLEVVAPARQLDWTRHASTVKAEAIETELGFTPRFSCQQAIDLCRGVELGENEPVNDPFGLDEPYHRRLSATLFRFLQRFWWRTEYRGLDHIPREGAAVLAGVHRGFQPWDGVMAMDQIARTTGRYLRFLVHPTLIKPPVLTPYMQKLGGVPACRENAEWILERGELLGIFPEGIRGAFRPYGPDIYELGNFGRDDFVRFAIRAQVPIVPFVSVGTAEIFPILARFDWSWWRRTVEWPYFPITPTMGTIPLPSKWHTRFLEPIPTDHLEPEQAEDRGLVRQLSAEARERMRGALNEMLSKRRHIFWGSLFEAEADVEGEAGAEDEAAAEGPS